MLGKVFASLIRSSSARARVGAKLAPRPVSPPSAPPPATAVDTRKKSRRDTSINLHPNGDKEASGVPPCRVSRIAMFISASDILNFVTHGGPRRVDYERLADLR